MFVWIFHRVSGILLIFLIAFQLLTGYFQDQYEQAHELHKATMLNGVLVFLFIFHSLYGIRTILMDLGNKREKLLFWAFNVLGLLLFAAFLIFLLPR